MEIEILAEAYCEACEQVRNAETLLLEKIKKAVREIFEAFNDEREDEVFLVGSDDFRVWLSPPALDIPTSVSIMIESLKTGPESYAQPSSCTQEVAEAMCVELSKEIVEALDLGRYDFSVQVSISPRYIFGPDIIAAIA